MLDYMIFNLKKWFNVDGNTVNANGKYYFAIPNKIVLSSNTDIYAYDSARIDGYQTGKKGQTFDCYGVYHELNGGYIEKGYYFLIIHPKSGALSVVPISVASPIWGVKPPKPLLTRLCTTFRKVVLACQ